MHIRVKKGLQVPLIGAPTPEVKSALQSDTVALDVSDYHYLRLKRLKRIGDEISQGEPLLQDSLCPMLKFVSPTSGKIVSINRGDKRRIVEIVIKKEGQRKFRFPKQDDKIQWLAESGLLHYVRMRPGDCLPHPNKPPQSIFVNGALNAPFAPPPELEIQGKEEDFQNGVTFLSSLAPVHLVGKSIAGYRNAEHHTVEGPYPSGNPSVHIYFIDPLLQRKKIIWTLGISGVIAIGLALREEYYNERIIGVGGEPFSQDKRWFYRVQIGHCVQKLAQDLPDHIRLLSGDPLTGKEISRTGFLGFQDKVISALKDEGVSQWLHFCRLGCNRFTTSRTYLSALRKKQQAFSTAQYGEQRAFVDADVYERVMPMQIPIMELMKAIMTKNYDLAEELGLLEVSPDDFALPSFVCPSKVPMMSIVRRGLDDYIEQYLCD